MNDSTTDKEQDVVSSRLKRVLCYAWVSDEDSLTIRGWSRKQDQLRYEWLVIATSPVSNVTQLS